MTDGSQHNGAGGYGSRLELVRRALTMLVERFEPDRFSGADACRLTALFAHIERLAATGKALAAKRVADTRAWQASGEASAADWLARISGQTPGQAGAAIDSARRLAHQPDVNTAARAGQLSEQQSAAVTAAAAKAPDQAQQLLETAAEASLEALKEQSRQIKLAANAATEKNRYLAIHRGRYLRTWTDDDGAGRISGRFTPDALAALRASLQPFHDHATETARRAGHPERSECHAADALIAMARAATGPAPEPDTPDAPAPDAREPGPNEPDCAEPDDSEPDDPASSPPDDGGGPDTPPAGDDVSPHNPRPPDTPSSRGHARDDHAPPGDDTTGKDPDKPPGDDDGGDQGDTPGDKRGREHRPALIIVRIDHAALTRGSRHADECCEIDGIGPVPVATVRAMMTDAFLAAVVTDGTDIRSVVHLGRQVTATQRTALIARDPRCVIPGCEVRTDLEIDHVEEWSPTRVTRLDQLARLCHRHHALKTYEGWRLHGPPGHWTWTPPTSPHPTPPPDNDDPPPRQHPPEDPAGGAAWRGSGAARPTTPGPNTDPSDTLFDFADPPPP
jgi:Domain of unknown function (DUF222)